MAERMIENRTKKLRELEAALPDVYGQFCKPTASRRFTIAA